MKIYFAASSIYRTTYKTIYKRVIDCLENKGHEVFGKTSGERLVSLNSVSLHKIREWQKEWLSYINNADLILIEGSYPSSIHIGFELGLALEKGKPIILLYKDGKNPVFINELYSNRLIKSEYTDKNIEEILKWCLKEAEQLTNRRFTFFISSEIESFLNNMSKQKNVNKSKYIRGLIEREIRKKTNSK